MVNFCAFVLKTKGIEMCLKKLKFTYKNLNRNITFSIFNPIFPLLCHFIQPWKITPFSTTIFSVSGVGEASPLLPLPPWY